MKWCRGAKCAKIWSLPKKKENRKYTQHKNTRIVHELGGGGGGGGGG